LSKRGCERERKRKDEPRFKEMQPSWDAWKAEGTYENRGIETRMTFFFFYYGATFVVQRRVEFKN